MIINNDAAMQLWIELRSWLPPPKSRLNTVNILNPEDLDTRGTHAF